MSNHFPDFKPLYDAMYNWAEETYERHGDSATIYDFINRIRRMASEGENVCKMLESLLEEMLKVPYKKLASEHGTEAGDDQQFDALYNGYFNLHVKFKNIIGEAENGKTK